MLTYTPEGANVRKISLVMAVFLVTACVSEVKPVLKPVEVDIPVRIAYQQKWLDEDIASKTVRREDAKPALDKINQIKEKYDRLQSAGGLMPEDSEEINRMLDESSDLIFRLEQSRRKSIISH
jgi:hypothetical protein